MCAACKVPDGFQPILVDQAAARAAYERQFRSAQKLAESLRQSTKDSA